MSKRKRFVVSSVLLSIGFVVMQFFQEYRFLSIGILSLMTLVLFVWSLWEGLGKNLTLLTLILPVYFTCGVGLFWFLLPVNIYTRIPVVLLYGFGIYALNLTANTFTVAVIKSIALLRAARGVGFVLTLLTSFLIYDTLLSLRLPIYLVSICIFIATCPLILQGIWMIDLGKRLSKELVYYSLIFSLLIAEITVGLFFWPVTVVVGSIFLTVSMYVFLGLGQAKHEGRLFSQTVREYVVIGIVVFIGMFLATSWVK